MDSELRRTLDHIYIKLFGAYMGRFMGDKTTGEYTRKLLDRVIKIASQNNGIEFKRLAYLAAEAKESGDAAAVVDALEEMLE